MSSVSAKAPSNTGTAPSPAGAVAVPATLRFRLMAAAEAMAVFAVCQLFLWHHSGPYRPLWLLILAYLIFSVWRRHYTAAQLGLRPTQGLGASRWVALGVVFGAVPVLAFGAIHGRVVLMRPDAGAALQFLGYLWWCVLQQFALQSFMHNRLLDATRHRHFASLMLGIVFGSLHLPNPVLTVATLAGGVAMGEVFARHRNIWLLALGQAVVSTAILVSFPDSWHHRLRVGPGFDRWPLDR